MKTIFTNSDLIHVFAQQTQSNGTNNTGSLFFNNNKLYSYGRHYLLAEFIDNNTILINDKGYSNTTSKHISMVSYATTQYKQFFTTKTDLNLVYNSVKTLKDKLSRAKKPELYINDIFDLYESLNKYLEYTKTKTKTAKTKEYRFIKKTVELLNSNDWEVELKKLAAKKEKEQKAKEKKQAQKFYNYESDFVPSNYAYLRVSKDGEKIETSKSANVPIREARILFDRIVNNKDIKGFKIGYYTVIGINGTLKIGCHEIKRKEIKKLATKLNWNY